MGGNSFLPTFWDDVDIAALKAYEALFVDDLSRMMAKSSSDVMLSHIQKLVQVCTVGCFYFFFPFALLLLWKIFRRFWGESLFVSGKLLDLEKKVATSKPVIKFLSTKNEMFKNKVAIQTVEAENDKERVAALEKSLQVKKDFCKLKDK